MATSTIRDFDDDRKTALRGRADAYGRSREAETRESSRVASTRPSPDVGMATRIRRRFADVDDASIAEPARTEHLRAGGVIVLVAPWSV